ncbi:MAG: dipeptide epimerase, partial [Pseudomonadota bacterium]
MHFSPSISARHERWPLANTFTIARGSKDAADVVVCTLSQDGHVGRGECVPYARYNESVDSVIAQIKAFESKAANGFTHASVERLMPPGAARFAVDAAAWDLSAKCSGKSVFNALGIDIGQPLTTAYTIVYDSPEAMRKDAQTHAARPLLKIKLARKGDLDRLKAVRDGAPEAELIVDANEGWDLRDFEDIAPDLAAEGVTTVEQPLPANADAALQAGSYPFSLCADESCHDRSSLAHLIGRYDMVNIKLDKTGGL